ncbi:hypothetical protein GCM10010416_15160 [Streptomyces caniferus]
MGLGQIAALTRLHHLGQIATKDVKGVALHQHPREPPTGQANHSVVASISEQLCLNALHHAIQPDITS